MGNKKFEKSFLLALRQMLVDFHMAFGVIGVPDYVDQDDLKSIERLQEIIEKIIGEKTIV